MFVELEVGSVTEAGTMAPQVDQQLGDQGMVQGEPQTSGSPKMPRAQRRLCWILPASEVRYRMRACKPG